MEKGFIDRILNDMELNSIVDMCRNYDGTVNVERALGVALARGYSSFKNQALIIRMAEIENDKVSRNRYQNIEAVKWNC